MESYPSAPIHDRHLFADPDSAPHPAIAVPIRPSLSPIAIRRVSWRSYHSTDDSANYTCSGVIGVISVVMVMVMVKMMMVVMILCKLDKWRLASASCVVRSQHCDRIGDRLE